MTLVGIARELAACSSFGRKCRSRVEHVALDATDSKRLIAAAQGAAAIYSCAAPPYHRWASEWPPLVASVCAAAEATGAVLVMLGTSTATVRWTVP